MIKMEVFLRSEIFQQEIAEVPTIKGINLWNHHVINNRFLIQLSNQFL